ncbi:unnamed protein product, partial [Oppiella nova]
MTISLTAQDLQSSMIFWAGLYALWWEMLNIIFRTYDYIYLKTMPYIKGNILDELYNYTQYHSHKFFQDNLAGHITNRITETARSFEMIISTFCEKIIRISILCTDKINRYSLNYAKSKSMVAGSIVDSITNISAVRMFTSHRFERKHLDTRISNAIVDEQTMQFFMFKLRYVLGLSCSIMIFITLYYLAFLRSQLIITIGDCVLIITLTNSVADDIWDLTQEIGDMFEEIGSFNQGSGKTTFVNLITRLHDIETDSLRKNISVIPQEPILFHRTILENISYGKKDASKEEVIEAAKIAHIHDFIMSLPQNYDNLCGERGNNLSGGQRQRIVIARAILKNAPILILDEATSSLDSETENLIQESLQYLMHNKTVLVIAHRLSTLLNMDRILVFESGSIVEDGQHKELLKNSRLYKKLWSSQVK